MIFDSFLDIASRRNKWISDGRNASIFLSAFITITCDLVVRYNTRGGADKPDCNGSFENTFYNESIKMNPNNLTFIINFSTILSINPMIFSH